jgi:hypothetical protein
MEDSQEWNQLHQTSYHQPGWFTQTGIYLKDFNEDTITYNTSTIWAIISSIYSYICFISHIRLYDCT